MLTKRIMRIIKEFAKMCIRMNIKYFHLCVCIEDHALQAQYSFRAFVVRVLKSMRCEHSTGARLARSEVEARASPV